MKFVQVLIAIIVIFYTLNSFTELREVSQPPVTALSQK